MSGTASASATPSKAMRLGLEAAIDHRRGAGRAQGRVDRQAQNGARMQREFALRLGDQGDEAGVVRARADLGEPDLVAFDEQLDAENARRRRGRR